MIAVLTANCGDPDYVIMRPMDTGNACASDPLNFVHPIQVKLGLDTTYHKGPNGECIGQNASDGASYYQVGIALDPQLFAEVTLTHD